MRICAQVLGRSLENNLIACNFYEFVLGVTRAKSLLQTKLISAAPLSDQICPGIVNQSCPLGVFIWLRFRQSRLVY
jgi:hypothetical protein